MVFLILRVATLILAFWLLWRLLAALFPAKRPAPTRGQDDWAEVLDEIEQLPETTDPHARDDD